MAKEFVKYIFFAVSVWLLSNSPLSFAGPVYSSRVGGLALVGPAQKHPGSIFYNPAILGYFVGHHLYLDSLVSLQDRRVALNRLDPQTGLQTSTLNEEEHSTRFTPQLFAAAISDLGLESVVTSIMVHTPAWTHTHYLKGPSDDYIDGTIQGPSRYHGTNFRLNLLYVTAAASLELSDDWQIGLSFSYVYAMLDYAFVRDAALLNGATRQNNEYLALDDCGEGQTCGYGNDRAAESIHTQGSASGFAIGVGIVGRILPSLTLGFGYASQVIGFGSSSLALSGDAWIRHSDAIMENASNLSGLSREIKGRTHIKFELPDIFSLGLTWKLNHDLLLSFQSRWYLYHRHSKLDIRLSGAELREHELIPRQIVHYRGFQDSFSFEIGGEYKINSKWSIQFALMVESSAIPTHALTPIAIDGWKLDSFIASHYRFTKNFSIGIGYNLIWIPKMDVNNTAFNPQTLVDCVDNKFNIDLESCQAALEGKGLAGANGNYQELSHRLGTNIRYDWD